MNEEELLKNYKEDVNALRQRAKDVNLTDKEIDAIFVDCFKCLEKSDVRNNKTKIIWSVISILLCGYVLLYVHQPTSSIVLRNVQGLIYPGLKFVRYLSMPIITKMPSLTGFYDESCLVFNPYFYVNNMECWPCENVHSVINLTGSDNRTLYESGVPYVVKVKQNPVLYEDLKFMYKEDSVIFNTDADQINSNKISYVSDFSSFEPETKSDVHISWRINRMLPARKLRKLFPRPHIMSEWSGQSIERFVLIDGTESKAYSLPHFECSYVFLIQASGERMIVLKPTKECRNKCKTVSVLLKPLDLLWYNWWYWRPISLPVENSTELSIGYISSYC